MKTMLCLTMLCGALAAHALDSAFVVGDDGLNKVMVFNRYQELVWEYPAVDPYSVEVLDNGNLLMTSSRNLLVEVNQAKEIVWSFSSVNEIFGAVRDGEVTIVGDCTAGEILFVDADGTIESSFATVSTATGHSTMRNLTLTSSDTILVAHLGDDTVREYSRGGVLMAEFAVRGSAYRGVRLDNGHTLVGHELGITEFDGAGVEVWDVASADIPDAGLSFGTCAYRLSNGNTVMGNWFGHGGTGEPLFELDGDNNIVWTMDDGVLDSPLAFIPVSDAWAATYSQELVDPVSVGGVDDSILFIYRRQYDRDHHNTATFFPSCTNEYNTGDYRPGAALKIFDPATGTVTTLLETSEGMIRDPDVHFSGEKIVFSMRKDTADSHHIYEINVDGSGLKQLTSLTDVDDLDPIYMPDGDIVFTSTREIKYIGCNRHISANLHKMDADGANIQQIARSTLFEDHPSLMPDGRIMYSRWEYVDRNFGDAQGLWVCDPDGTGHAIYYGNNTTSPGGVLDGQVIPGTPYTICTFSSCHDVPWGAIAIIDRRLGVDGRDPVVRTWPEGLESWVKTAGQDYDRFKNTAIRHEDPWPLLDPDTGVGGRYFLCSREITGSSSHMGLYLLDTEGESTLLYSEGTGTWGCFDPMPLAPRTTPNDVTVYRKNNGADGRFYVQDVYEGTHMADVERGEVKYLRVIDAPNKTDFVPDAQWSGQGRESPGMNWHNFQNKRILGTVPVEEDGSAHFNAPSSTFLFFQLLDENKMMVQSMRTATIIQPNENQGCIGCHDDRTMAPPAYGDNSLPLATLREPSQLEGWYGDARNFGYLTEVQPVFDAHCMPCHDFDGSASGTLILAGDKGLFFNASYTELNNKGYTGRIGAGPAEIQEAKSWGSHASTLMAKILSGHNSSAMTTEEFERIATWLDMNSPYYPHFSSNYPNNLAGRSPLSTAQKNALEGYTGKNFDGMTGWNKNPGPMVCFDRPEKSPCLDALTVGSANYNSALAIIQAGQDALNALPRADMPGFYKATALDLWHAATWTDRRNREELNQTAITEGLKVYDSQPLILTANKGAEGIDGVSALVSGEVLYCVSNTVVDVTVCWGSYDGGDDISDWQYSTDLPSQSEGDFSVTLTGLVPGANIYFRVFVINADGTVAAYESTLFDTRSLIDLDSDGMADSWETAHFGSSSTELPGDDWDKDGLTNEEEYWVGTDPTNSASCLVIEGLELDGSDLSIAWQSSVNGEYTLEYSTNLAVNSWIPLMVDQAATAPQNIYSTNAPSAEVRYYRVRGRRTDR
jgi:hypothetical protein